MNVVQSEAAPFFFKRGKVGCLLVHGFTGAPAEMRWLGEQLAESDYSALGVRLFAHGTDQKDMLRAKWRDWYLSVVDGYHLLGGQCDQIFVVGLSLGGVLSLLLGTQHPVTGIVALSTPYSVPDSRVKPLLPLIPIISRLWRFKSKDTPDWVNPELQKDHFEYPAYPLIGLNELHLILKEMREQLPTVTAPTLIIHSKTDRSISDEHPKNILDRLGCDDKELKWLEKSGHVITRDVEKERVFQEIVKFIQKVSLKNESGFNSGNPNQ
jgi:carboxylesterase